ncbi:hypothetical protein CONPUDRAFT_136385 [Coniophora puteana RWD-64-598 SS2]|uniref:F-box domain-containing protein n=1 Tax=Coniophora puteana (strain RWD-64-598) TaxID=741705 RepID=A0A5M3MVZ3_CONPW|nr:uncharacterized protein CONPUDRAFT_136385 [Coniophora puteana RWD-64-598 SS2]EIW83313.1 hypothetical protein CONPUDRAFT_136385 [Coniophora puteana RWD-64-598 SS2]
MTAVIFPLLPVIAASCPSLQQFSVSEKSEDDSSMLSTALQEVLPSMRTIEGLSCGQLSFNGLSAVAELPYLKRIRFVPPLKLSQPSSAKKSASQKRKEKVVNKVNSKFPSLTQCSLLSRPMDSHQEFFDRIGYLPRLRELLCVTSSYTVQQLAAFFDTLHSHINPSELSVISIIGCNKSIGTQVRDSDVSPITMSILRPLLSFAKLEKLVIWTMMTFSLDDDDIEAMARAWPKLRSLAITGYEGWLDNQKISLWGLASLVQHCPELENLEIVLDATVHRNLPSPSIPANMLVTGISIDDSPIKDPFYVASYLSHIFPRLSAIYCWKSADLPARENADKYEKKWEEVEKFLKLLSCKHQYENFWRNASGRRSKAAPTYTFVAMEELWDGTLVCP